MVAALELLPNEHKTRLGAIAVKMHTTLKAFIDA
jgi:hypothetical protein